MKTLKRLTALALVGAMALSLAACGSSKKKVTVKEFKKILGKADFEVEESEDEDADGYPLDFFIGFQLRDTDGTVVGEIIDVDEQTENAIFIVARDDEELMIPAVDDLIVEFDLDNKVMVMDIPQGLLDLNK